MHQFLSDLDLVARAVKERDAAAERIYDALKEVRRGPLAPLPGSKFQIVQSSEMGNWSASQVSETLKALGEKIHHMITGRRGTPSSVQPMLEAMLCRGVKKLRKPSLYGPGEWEFLGYGHFRWDHGTVYILQPWELDFIRTYFNLKPCPVPAIKS